MTPSTLLVHCDRGLVGTLRRRDGGMSFAYAESWIASEDGFAVSLSLPLDGDFDDARATRFFANLLPEANVRTLVCRRLGISEGNDFALLAAIGGECAGALSILPDGADPAARSDEYELLPPKKLAELASGYDALPLVDGDGRARLSLAGAQDKLPVKIDGARVLLPIGGSPSTHILKFPNRDYKHLPANEVVVMELARRVGLPTVRSGFRPIGAEGLCLVERYDRVRASGGGAIERLHQEDFCQATGRGASAKYEDEGGPSFATSVELVREHSVTPLEDVDALVRWLAFNAIAGNADGHAKNLSLLMRDGLRLAPFYDLVCTRSYEALDRRLAMNVGGERDPDRLRATHLEACARSLDLKPRLLYDTFAVTADKILGALDEAVAAAEVGESPAVQRLRPAIRKQARRWLRELESARR